MNPGFVETFISKYLSFWENAWKQCYFPRFPSKFFPFDRFEEKLSDAQDD